MKLSSDSFNYGERIPLVFTADGRDISPPLKIENAPEDTVSFALIVDDPDAPVRKGVWDHWLLWNIPEDVHLIDQGSFPSSAVQGKNDFGRLAYGGPAPPSGTHRYFFKLYALDVLLDLPSGASRTQLEEAIKGHVLAEAVLMGVYSR